MTEWRLSTWGEEISLEYGKALRGYGDAKGPVPVYGTNGPVGWTDEPLAPGPGVILGRKGAYRGVHFSSKPFFVIDTAYYAVPKTKLDMRWLYYAMIYHKLGEIDDGSPIPSTTRAAVYPRELEVPEPQEQSAIATVLGALDDKVELNLKMNETLEAMALAIFKHWFVDFGPVYAKSEGRPTGLRDDVATLFPDGFGDDGLPAGWITSPLSDLATLDRSTRDPVDFANELVEHFSLPAFDRGMRPTVERASIIKSLKLELAPPLVLFSKLNPDVARVWPVLARSARPMLASTEFLALKPRPGRASLAYLSLLFASSSFRRTAAGLVTGTSKSHQRVQPAALLQSEWLAPNPKLLSAFDTVVEPILSRIDSLRSESKVLTDLRNTLLPKLMSGKARISDAERIIGEVGA